MLPRPTPADLLFALALVALGFCFWEWHILEYGGAGIGTTLFFLLAIVATFFYLRAKGIAQNARSLLLLASALAGAAPFALYGFRDWVNLIFLLLEGLLCLLWVAYSCRTIIAQRLSGFIVGDLFSQVFIVPFTNLSAFFTRPFAGVGTRRSLMLPVIFAVAGVIVCVPLFAIIISLLVSSDDAFRSFAENLFERFAVDEVMRYVFNFIFGIPVAIYIFGAVVGNVFRNHTAIISRDKLGHAFSAAHALPRAALYTPLVLLVGLYIVYFITMANYLFSGLFSELPGTYTYAEYARSGFFELCGVASINLGLLALIWLFARRDDGEHPLPLRLLAGVLSLLTCLLIVTAASKMLLYIESYGLTPLRVYTVWFMALMLLVFLLLVAWHIRPFNAARPIVVLVLVAVLTLGLVNTNGFIAEHNVQRYLDGRATEFTESPARPDYTPEGIDVAFLLRLGDPAIPALYELKEKAQDEKVRLAAADAIETICGPLHEDEWWPSQPGWPGWNLASHRAASLYENTPTP
jgi:hypothetical protein